MEYVENNMNHEGMVEIFCRYIRKNRRIIYPRNARFFHFWVPADKARKFGS